MCLRLKTSVVTPQNSITKRMLIALILADSDSLLVVSPVMNSLVWIVQWSSCVVIMSFIYAIPSRIVLQGLAGRHRHVPLSIHIMIRDEPKRFRNMWVPLNVVCMWRQETRSPWKENVCGHSRINCLAALNDNMYFFIPEITALKRVFLQMVQHQR